MIELSSGELTVACPLLRDFPRKQDFIHSVYDGKQRGRIVEDWDSAQNFLEHRVGFCLTVDSRIASVCYSVTSGNGIVPIQIDTREEYCRKGLAFITFAAFIEHCLECGLRPRWECDVSNVASASLARMLGFALHSELTVFRMTE